MKNQFNNFILGLALVVFGVMLGFGALNYNGICISERRSLSDQEKITIAVERVNSLPKVTVPGMGAKSVRDYVPYKSAEEFLQRNPNCCTIHHKPFQDLVAPRSFVSRLLGLDNATVIVAYRAAYINEDGFTSYFLNKNAVNIQNCGKIN